MRKGLLLVLLLLTVVSGAALAQTTTGEVYCGDLSADDCAILEQSQTAMQNLTAASFDLFVDVQIEAEGEQMPISLVGSGAYSGLDRNADLSLDGMAALTALRGFNAELMLTATLPQSLVEESESPNTLTLELRLVDGVGYPQFRSAAAAHQGPAVHGLGRSGSRRADRRAPRRQSRDFQRTRLDGRWFGRQPEMFTNMDTQAVEQYLTITRTDEGSGANATFETTVDFAGLLADPAFQDTLRQQMDASGQGTTEADQQEAFDQVSSAFQDATLLIRQEVDTASGRTASLSVEFDVAVTDAEDPSENGSAAVTAMIDYDYENVPTLTAPENASVLPYQQLLGMVGGMLGDMGGALGESSGSDAGGTSTDGSLSGQPAVTPEPTAAG
ncbi:MAG: hypothetical protein IPK17_07800 [Chloroflexi bacterium]|uniref:hypothetical protein n=1 Tax=Candidatus Flexifilum breve TaxID=3140694 RepID=UPI0031367FDD|nr:hypothetical protein [Chloroflexota bacterium]